MNSVKYFNSIAKEWNKMRVDYFKDELREMAIKSVDISNKVIADLGAGTGFISLGIAKKANLVFSLDSSKNMLKELYSSAKENEINNIYPIKGELENLPLFDDSIDLIFMNMALHHVANPYKAIKEMNRVLKPNGKVVITDVLEHKGEWAREEMFDTWLGFNYDQLINWFEKAGFKNISIKNTGLVARGESSFGEVIEPGIFMAIAKK
ncbi:class I SAM-dependent methyltransferase [Clostridium perfringens]|uniref:class I SAM-dependent methyltransferase n=1 Tax=Clostridium perfringens TaxID=1502 RepID=UPI002911E94F|nr:class I SAM-dependent methyltransferase [Clostridium perfringens]EJT6171966.1 class I SAM-dependent methyltransferase [Clostridium perfringens]EJT6542788.1 class I SAM-dependent methyltransferase [Clostridium perfringens]EJT6567698.1 class I SAM-dependent methyltransferase [Clostridium perfringens]MBS5995651.1 class I SAM-dependent methyltransferase [Clostridium perfringens]MDM0998145.1 class I SAM-dependent methyltransferase [Clostridium perfringens]